MLCFWNDEKTKIIKNTLKFGEELKKMYNYDHARILRRKKRKNLG